MRVLAGTVLMLALAGCAPEEPVVAAPQAVSVAQDEIGSLLNAERAAAGLSALSRNLKLEAAAAVHAQDMAGTGDFSHIGSDGSKPSARVKSQGYSYCYVAENIALGQPDAGAAMASWMESAGHRKNNLSEKATEYGAARAAGNYWVLVFGRPGC